MDEIFKNNRNCYSLRTLSSRTRRPDRAVYVPRAKRSQTTPPTPSTQLSPLKSPHNRKAKNSKSKSIDEPHSTSNSSEDAFDLAQEDLINAAVINGDRLVGANCDLIKQIDREVGNENSTNEKNQKNLNNLNTMSDSAKVMTIESAAGIGDTKVDKDEKELIKASQEINRSNRKLIKQTFNSNVLEIEAAGGSTEPKTEEETGKNDDDDWDTLWVALRRDKNGLIDFCFRFNDDGECLDPKMLDELTEAVGKVKIEKPKSNYQAYLANVDLLKDEEYPHVLECSNFPIEFRQQVSHLKIY